MLLSFAFILACLVSLAVLVPEWSEQVDTRETPIGNWNFTRCATEIFDALAVDATPLTAPRSTVEIVDLRTGEIVSRFGVVSHVIIKKDEHGTHYSCADSHRRNGPTSDRGAWINSAVDRVAYLDGRRLRDASGRVSL